jgi:hypothetical protein
MEKLILYPKIAENEKMPTLEQQDIEIIENLPISLLDRIEILLVKAQAKPASDIEFYSKDWGQFERSKKLDKKKIRAVIDGLNKLGLPCYPKKYKNQNEIMKRDKGRETGPYERERMDIVYGKDQKSLDALMIAEDGKNMGEAYGFPRTAIEAYLGEREVIKREDLPRWIRRLEFFPFVTFSVLSVNNWMEELKIAERWALTVKRNSPKLYNEYVKDVRENVKKF